MIVQLVDLEKVYNKKSNMVAALKGVSFDVDQSEFVSVVGRSGSGKSTLLNLIGGLDSPSSGKIIFNGKSMDIMSKKELERHRRFSIGMVFQSFNLISYRTALDNVILPMVFAEISVKDRKKRAAELLESVGLADRMNHVPAEMSGGEAQRVAIARALANNPAMILADEPTGNLDSNTSDEIMNLLLDLNKNRNIPIMMITHEAEIAHKVSDKVVTLFDGKVLKTEYKKDGKL